MESNIKHKLWVEKYRPNSLENYICTDSVRTYVENSINKQDISHLLLAGPAGGGKCLGFDEKVTVELELTDEEVNRLREMGVEFL